jgi:hypothetical protein
MKIRFNLKLEKTVQSWLWRLLFGPALLVDGSLSILTFGCVNIGASLEVARKLAKSRFTI